MEGKRRVASTKTWEVLSQESLLRGEPPRKFAEICLKDHQRLLFVCEKQSRIRVKDAHLVLWEVSGIRSGYGVSGPSDQ